MVYENTRAIASASDALANCLGVSEEGSWVIREIARLGNFITIDPIATVIVGDSDGRQFESPTMRKSCHRRQRPLQPATLLSRGSRAPQSALETRPCETKL